MNAEEKDIELVENFLDNKLDQVELEQFNSRLEESAEFKQLYNEIRVLKKGIQAVARNKLLQDLKDVDKQMDKESNGKKANTRSIFLDKRVWLAVAASVILVIFLPNLFDGDKNQKVYQEFFEPYPNIYQTQQRSSANEATDIDKAFAFYDNAQYENAIPLFEEIIKKEPVDNISFYLAVAYMANGNTEKAINLLQKEFSTLNVQANWYLSLCYIKENRIKEAKQILSEIEKQNNSYSEKALLILQTLK